MQRIFIFILLVMVSLPIAAAEHSNTQQTSFFTTKQEQYLAKNLHVYAYFTQIYTYHKTPEQMAKEYHLSNKTNKKYLKALADIEVIKKPNDTLSTPVEFLVKGTSRFSTNGPLSKKVTETMLKQYHQKAVQEPNSLSTSTVGYWLTQKEYEHYKREMKTLENKYITISMRNRKSNNPASFRTSVLTQIIPKWEPNIFNDVRKNF